MPVQRTFTLVQQPAAAPAAGPGPGPARPMTSKQVREAYKAATRAPPVPRAERRRQERAEQERIRRELDRDAAAARARKRDRELAERERRKRHGLPLAAARPSQATISRFARRGVSPTRPDAAGPRVPAETADQQPDGEPAEQEPGGELQLCSGEEWGDLDLIPDEDELDLEMLGQLDAVAADEQGRSPGPAEDAEPQPAAPERRPSSQARPVTPYELDLGLRAVPSPKAPPAPPPSTQAILFNPDDFFPSSSQQERELLDEKTTKPRPTPPEPADRPTTPIPRQASPSRAPPRRFFTPSGSHERLTLALQRSRRSAALQDTRDRQRPQGSGQGPGPHGTTVRGQAESTAKQRQHAAREQATTKTISDEENVAPPASPDGPSASQETEYGGGWMDDMALELMI